MRSRGVPWQVLGTRTQGVQIPHVPPCRTYSSVQKSYLLYGDGSSGSYDAMIHFQKHCESLKKKYFFIIISSEKLIFFTTDFFALLKACSCTSIS